ncbi:hypothetical protein GYA13_04525 [Candidatus Kuenenbacteria bacterium]|nr:hypothetical protein [Candidatus Kuenenbacteria bacterium]
MSVISKTDSRRTVEFILNRGMNNFVSTTMGAREVPENPETGKNVLFERRPKTAPR